MIIPLTRPPISSSPAPLPPNLIKLGTALLLLELQGSLELRGTPGEGEAGGVVGEFKMNGEKPTLRIGHHMLEGKVVTLPKPLAVLRKRTSPSHQRLPPSGTSDSADEPAPHKAAAEEEEDEIALDAQAGGGTSYEVVEVVRKKVVFARRPALVIDKPAAAGGGKK